MRRLVVCVLLAVVVAACGGGGDDDRADATEDADASGVRRIAGADAYETAAAIALDEYDSASDPVLGNGDDPADALAGSYLAATHGSAVLLTRRDELPRSTVDALASLRSRTIHVLGGTAAVGPEVEAQLTSLGYTVNRVAGPDRYATAVAVAKEEGTAILGIWPGEGRTVFLANGQRPSDALTAGPLAYSLLLPILLTDAAALPAVTASALDELAVEHVIVLGGTAAVSEAVVAQLEGTGRTVRRVAGPDRAATAVAVADLFEEVGVSPTSVDLAAADAVAELLAAGPHARPDTPILLCVTVDDCGDATVGWARGRSLAEVVVLGPESEVALRAAQALLER